MTDERERQKGEVAGSLSKALSLHGHGFHYAVMKAAEELYYADKSIWRLEVAELPVEVGNHATHIDFVFRSKRGHTFLIGECKRADPAKARWTFVRAPYTARDARVGELVFEQVLYDPAGPSHSQGYKVFTDGAVVHLGLDLKTGARGHGSTSRSPINVAAAQALKGMNGLVNDLFCSGRERADKARVFRFIPAVFTTADIWVSDVDLSAANLETGEVEVQNATRRKWIWFNHNQSPALRHDVRVSEMSVDLASALRQEFCRTIAVVGANGVEDFLGRDWEAWLDDFQVS